MTQNKFQAIVLSYTKCPNCGESKHLPFEVVLLDPLCVSHKTGIQPVCIQSSYYGNQYNNLKKTLKNHGLLKHKLWHCIGFKCRTCNLIFDSKPIPDKNDLSRKEMDKYIRYTIPDMSLEDYSSIMYDYIYGKDD